MEMQVEELKSAEEPKSTNNEFVRISSVIRRYGISGNTLRRAIERGELEAIRNGRRGMYKVRESSLREFINATPD